MMLLSTLALCAGSSLATAGLTALYFRSRLRTVIAQRDLYYSWWERDSGKMIVAQARLDLIHQQHVDAGRKAHEPWRALRRQTTEKLMRCVAARDANDVQPAAANPALGFPAAHSAASITGGRGRETHRHDGQDTGAGQFPDATQRARAGNKPGQSCRRNRAGNFAPAETPKQKGA